MTAPVYPGAIAGYCGRCGTPLNVGHGAFCRTCGNRLGTQQPAVAVNYSYPVVPSASVPAAQHKLGHARFVIFGALVLGVLVGAITAVTVSLKPSITYCRFSCGPDVGPRLLASTHYQSSQFGYRVEYDTRAFSVSNQTATGMELSGNYGAMVFNATAGPDVSGAITKAVNSINTSTFQNMKVLSSVIPGAEIGFVAGTGETFTADYDPPGGGTSRVVSVAVMAATNGTFTLSAIAIGAQDLTSPDLLPFGFADGQILDYPLTNTVWPGQQ